ncbi:tyrosine-type recombinase/integrase [Pseudomonas salomonii]|uniref:Integrase n=1 Tax=Pseudomonas salomonii TaxID=191391 RepID=A0A1H3J9U0_9PSED|nr:tyrosine-type recombinase/integrase [Pseudomonas salomonii]SDY36168.1 Integrase [Pseudomonas salomonii]
MKRTEIKKRPLSVRALDALEAEAKTYREPYGVDNLYFVVKASGAKGWELRYKKGNGKWAWTGLGGYPNTGVEAVRARVSEILAALREGIDPLASKAQGRIAVGNTFAVVAEEWYQKKIDAGRAVSTLKGIRAALDNDILPIIGAIPIQKVSRAHCAAIQEAIEKRGAHDSAKKARSWLGMIFGYAIAKDYCENNPASNLLQLAASKPQAQQHPHLLEQGIGGFVKALRTSNSGPITTAAAWLNFWTASRPGMIRSLEWSDLDLDNGTWNVPEEKMKMKREHIVPLSPKIVDLLTDLKKITGRQKFVFPIQGGIKGSYISDGTINKCYANVGYKRLMTGHGSRHTATTLLEEHGWESKWISMQLSHKKRGLQGVYNKAAYLKPRTLMMEWYVEYTECLAKGISPEEAQSFARRVQEAKAKY